MRQSVSCIRNIYDGTFVTFILLFFEHYGILVVRIHSSCYSANKE